MQVEIHPETRDHAAAVAGREQRWHEAEINVRADSGCPSSDRRKLPQVTELQLADGEDAGDVLVDVQIVRGLADDLEPPEPRMHPPGIVTRDSTRAACVVLSTTPPGTTLVS